MKRLLYAAVLVACAHGDRDRDHDGVPDKWDLCPDQPEDRDGYEDADGCPDPDCDDCCSFISEASIHFTMTDSAIPKAEEPVLDHVAEELRKRREIRKVQLNGSGPERDDFRVSELRAKNVRNALIARGIAPDRLVAYSRSGGGPPVVTFRILNASCPPGG